MLAATFICGSSVFTACSNNDAPVTPPSQDEVEEQLQKMTLREKVGQLFYVRPECLDTTIHFNQPSGIDGSTDDIKEIKMQAVNATMLGVNEKYPKTVNQMIVSKKPCRPKNFPETLVRFGDFSYFCTLIRYIRNEYEI